MMLKPGEAAEKYPTDRMGSDSDEMSDEAVERLDHIDNTTNNYIQDLITGVNVEGLVDEDGDVNWNMEHIGAINDMVIEYLKSVGFHVWHPYVGDEEANDGKI